MKFCNENYDGAIKYLKDHGKKCCSIIGTNLYYKRCMGSCEECEYILDFRKELSRNKMIQTIKNMVLYNRKQIDQCGKCLIFPCKNKYYCADRFCKMFNLEIEDEVRKYK